MLGLAKAKRIPPQPKLLPGKNHIDMETLKAVILNRFQVMSRYTKEVLIPVFSQEKLQDVDETTRGRIKNLLVRETSLLDVNAKTRLAGFLAGNKSLQQAYLFKERLQNIWNQTALRDNDLLEALQKWCQEAEASGISRMQEFSAYLKSFTLTTA
jgi:stearoyl-CoA desaturase (delta-9 desaturase)